MLPEITDSLARANHARIAPPRARQGGVGVTHTMKTSRTGIHNPEFLALNRQGKIAGEQKAALISASASTHGGWLGLLLAGVGMVVVVLAFGKTISRMGKTGEVLGAAILVAILIVSYLIVHEIFVGLEHLRWLGVRVERREGRVEFRNGHYLPEANGKTLYSVFQDAFNLSPGPCVFYCAKGSKWILALERPGGAAATAGEAAADAGPVDLAEVQRALGMTIGFNPDDLQLNRQGRISHRQRRRLLGLMRSGLYGTVLGAGFAGFLLVYGFLLHPEKPKLPFVAGAGFGVLAMVMSFKGLAAGLADSLAGSVRSGEGRVTRFTETRRGGRSSYTDYYFGLDELRFSVSSVAYEALIEGLTYRVFYLPRTRMILGMEPLSS